MNNNDSSTKRVHRDLRLTKGLLALVICIGMLLPMAVGAEGWKFQITPYLWAPSAKGTTSVGPINSDIDVSPAEDDSDGRRVGGPGKRYDRRSGDIARRQHYVDLGIGRPVPIKRITTPSIGGSEK